MSDAATTSSDEPRQPIIPSLPEDVAINCLNRVPRIYHPILSILSKPIRSLLSSPHFYTSRSSTEHFLYLSLRLPSTATVSWFTLTQKLNQDGKHLLIPVPPIPSISLIGSAYVSIGYQIYVIGGSIKEVPSPHVWILDCRFHTWRRAPDMRVGREFAAAGIVDGKIYVIGGCVANSTARASNWTEVFDLKSESWQPVPSPEDVRAKWMHASAVMEGKIYAMADRNGVVYSPREGQWDSPEKRLDLGWRGRACVIGNVLYCYDYLGKIRGYTSKERVWRALRGVEDLPDFLCGATMANVDGKLVVLWEGRGGGKGREVEIWCAEIVLERRNDAELWGRIEWSDVVLSVPSGSGIINCLEATF